MLARDAAELLRSPALLALVLLVPPCMLLLIGTLNVHPVITRMAVVAEESPAGASAQSELRRHASEIAALEWVEWPAGVTDLRERAVREGVDIVLLRSDGDWRAYSAVTRSARAAPAQEAVQLLMLSLQREDQSLQEIRQLDEVYERLPAGADGDAARKQIEEMKEQVLRKAALPTPLLGVWLAAKSTPLWAPASGADHALVPAYIALIGVFVPFVLASTALAREREAGMLAELLMVSRRRWPLLALGKLLLPLLAGLVANMLLLVVAALAFDFGIKPGLVEAVALQALAAAVSALFGLGVSAWVDSSQEAYAVSAVYLVTLILLTGMVYPLEQAAPTVVAVAHLFPLSLSAPALEAWMMAGASAHTSSKTWITLAGQGLAALLLLGTTLRRLKANL